VNWPITVENVMQFSINCRCAYCLRFCTCLSVQIVSVIFSRAQRGNVLLVFFLLTKKRFSRNNAGYFGILEQKKARKTY